MRQSNFTYVVIFVMLVLTSLSSCKKEEDSYTGQVKITFTNHPADLQVYFSPIENPDEAITYWLKPDKNGVLIYDLNFGNYILTCWSATHFSKVGFQIRVGETTEIIYNSINEGIVQ